MGWTRRQILRKGATTFVWSLGAGFLWRSAQAAAASLAQGTVAALEQEGLIYVATQRKSGARSSIKPIWFMYEGGSLYFTTSPESWKAKRLRRGSPLYIWVGSEDGPYLLGKAERITDPVVISRMGAFYSNKYWIAWMGLFRPSVDRVAAGKTLAYRVSLEEGTPPPSAS